MAEHRESSPTVKSPPPAPREPLFPAWLAEIRARCDAATPGPWEWTGQSISSSPAGHVTTDPVMEWVDSGGAEIEGYSDEQMDCDGEFIAHSITDIAALLTEVARLTNALRAAARLLEPCTHYDVIDDAEASDYDGLGDRGEWMEMALENRIGHAKGVRDYLLANVRTYQAAEAESEGGSDAD